MTEKFIVVWRSSQGAAVQTYAEPDKSPRVFADADTGDAGSVEWADAATLAGLLEKHEAFQPKRVALSAARDLLGWDV